MAKMRSVATLKGRTPVAVSLDIREMARTVQVINYIYTVPCMFRDQSTVSVVLKCT